MSTFAVMLVKDELDCIETVVRHTQKQVDHVIVADNGSTDGTRQLLDRLGVEVIDDDEIGYWQSAKMNALAERAREQGAKWVVPVDADELWLAREGRLGDVLSSLPDTVLLAQATLFDYRPTAKDTGKDAIKRMGWRQSQAMPMRKVACRALPGIGLTPGNHACGFRDIEVAPAVLDALVVFHYPYRSIEQFVRKIENGVRAYAATDLPEHFGAHKRAYGRVLAAEGPEGLARVFHEEFFSQDPEADGLVYDPAL